MFDMTLKQKSHTDWWATLGGTSNRAGYTCENTFSFWNSGSLFSVLFHLTINDVCGQLLISAIWKHYTTVIRRDICLVYIYIVEWTTETNRSHNIRIRQRGISFRRGAKFSTSENGREWHGEYETRSVIGLWIEFWLLFSSHCFCWGTKDFQKGYENW